MQHDDLSVTAAFRKWKTEVVQAYLWLLSKFQANLGYMRSYPPNPTKRKLLLKVLNSEAISPYEYIPYIFPLSDPRACLQTPH
ncbi:rCG63716 [Rattus norvegicus]|uniref:RCG63716 n=1 Tax=Rattus norvegicus TaxID=10116 RepID=A6I8G9_RAT|nr:rCG63716 [Rattus norvegicus]